MCRSVDGRVNTHAPCTGVFILILIILIFHIDLITVPGEERGDSGTVVTTVGYQYAISKWQE